MKVHIKGRNVLVTGSSMGIGKGLSECFAKEGANLVLADHPGQHERLEEWAAELGSTYQDQDMDLLCRSYGIRRTRTTV